MKGKIIKEIQYNGKIIPWIEDYFLFLNLFNADMLQFDTKRLAELFGMLDWRILPPPPQNWAHINVFAPLLSLFLFNLMAKDNVVFTFSIGQRRTMSSLLFQLDSEGQCRLWLFNLMAEGQCRLNLFNHKAEGQYCLYFFNLISEGQCCLYLFNLMAEEQCRLYLFNLAAKDNVVFTFSIWWWKSNVVFTFSIWRQRTMVSLLFQSDGGRTRSSLPFQSDGGRLRDSHAGWDRRRPQHR